MPCNTVWSKTGSRNAGQRKISIWRKRGTTSIGPDRKPLSTGAGRQFLTCVPGTLEEAL